MTEEQAWNEINRQIKREDNRLIMVVVSLFLVIAGVAVIIFCAPAGLVTMAAGIISMTFSSRHVPGKSVDIDEIYEENILAKWLLDYFESVDFKSPECIDVSEVKKLGIFDNKGTDVSVSRSFSCTRGKISVRACEVVVSQRNGSQGKSRIDYDEPSYVFWGRLWEADVTNEPSEQAVSLMKSKNIDYRVKDGKICFFHNLYSEEGPYPVWLPAPSKDNRDPKMLRDEVQKQISPYAEIIDMLAK